MPTRSRQRGKLCSIRAKPKDNDGAHHSRACGGNRRGGIAQDNPAAATRLLARFDRLFHTLAAQPNSGKKVDELAPNLRLMPLGSYLIFYRPLPDGVEIARILHGARDISAEFFRE
jgi:toxin ParE1/3/4